MSHMGFVLLGISVWNTMALQGVMMQIICHGVATGALFMLAGALQERLKTRDLNRLGGLWSEMPRMGGVGLFFALASLGLPGLGNFMAEFMILLGTYRVTAPGAAFAAAGLVLAAVYAIRLGVADLFRRGGTASRAAAVRDFTVREMVPMAVLISVILWLGLFPQAVINLREAGHWSASRRCRRDDDHVPRFPRQVRRGERKREYEPL